MLPIIIELNDFGGNYTAYEDELYKVYLAIFHPPLMYEGKPVYPVVDPKEGNRHYTFLHITSTGRVEATRDLDLRRCERINAIRPIIENCNSVSVKVWKTKRKGRKRVVIWHEESQVKIILEENGKCYKLITTFIVSSARKIQESKVEYATYLKSLEA